MGEDNCHPTLANCTDLVGGSGSFECTCITGYTGDGVTCTGMCMHTCNVSSISTIIIICVGINGCTMDDDCVNNAECIANDGMNTCTCSSGYSGDGTNNCTSK